MQQRLTLFERQRIASYRRVGLGVRQIARRLGRDHSVVSRELRRNGAPYWAYDAARAERVQASRTHRTNRHKLDTDEQLRDWVEARLEAGWSPEQIAGRLKEHPPPELRGKCVSYESIYRYIYAKAPWLYHALRKAHPVRRPKRGRTPQTTRNPGKQSIWERPEAATNRTELGHWESDTLEGKRGRGQHLSVHEERLTRFVRLHRLGSKAASDTLAAWEHTRYTVPLATLQTLTVDNGAENASWKELGIPTFFADPYCSWQKGSVENTNGLIRQYFPKRTDFTQVTDDQLQEVEDRLNHRPRKCLQYQTPSEMFTSLSGALNS